MNLVLSLKKFFSNIKNGFILLPSIVIVTILCLGIWVLSFSELDELVKNVPFIVIHELDTIRAILTAFLTGLISITVFSFSMVMLVLSQASSNYSPRILNWMVGDRGNQYILGIYLGTILLTMLLLLQLPADENEIPTFHLAVLLDAVLTFYCLMLFISFINRVSNDIQITNITTNLFFKTEKKLKEESELKTEKRAEQNSKFEWIEHSAYLSGYLQKLDRDALLDILIKHDLYFKIEYKFGHYYMSGIPLYSMNREIKEEEILREIERTFSCYPGEQINDQAFFGFRQLSEIAVKALSPGINDPGTAHQCIDYLTHLFKLKMESDNPTIALDKEGRERIYIKGYSVDQLLKICMLPILQYGYKDGRVLEILLVFVKNLAVNDKDKRFRNEIAAFFESLQFEINKHKENNYLYGHLKGLIDSSIPKDYLPVNTTY